MITIPWNMGQGQSSEDDYPSDDLGNEEEGSGLKNESLGKQITFENLDAKKSAKSPEKHVKAVHSAGGGLSSNTSTGLLTCHNISFKQLDNDKWQCLECHASELARGSLNRHSVHFHTNKFVCDECGKRFGSNDALKDHVNYIHLRIQRSKDHLCPICGKPFDRQDRVRKHMVSHMSAQDKEEAIARGEKLPKWHDSTNYLYCEECGRKFASTDKLTEHKFNFHPSEDATEGEKLFNKEMCPDCGKLICRESMKEHRRRVHGEEKEKRFMCSICDKKFFKANELRRHKEKVHEKLKPWKCPTCPKQFAEQRHLTWHINVCQNIRPFKCEHCPIPMAFGRKHHLERHFENYHEKESAPKRHKHLRNVAAKVDP